MVPSQSHPEELLASEGCWGKKVIVFSDDVIVFSDVIADEEWVVPHPSSLERPYLNPMGHKTKM